MARIIVRLHGTVVANVELETGAEYIAGRASDAHIVLGEERGISRQHLKFLERDGMWVCESLSKFVLMQKGGQSLEVIELNEETNFTLPPYSFQFEPTQAEEPAVELPEEPRAMNLPSTAPQAIAGEHTSPRFASNDATTAGVSSLVPYIRVSYPNTADDEVLKLEGHLWTAGRDPSSEIPIDSPHISRKHFELARTVEGFFITDLGSSNGTKINGQKIPPHEPTRLESGDEIRVMNVTMQFEIRDTQFNNRIDNLPVAAFDPMLAAPPPGQWPMYQDEPTQFRTGGLPQEFPSDWKRLRPHHLKQVDWKKNKVRMALVVLIPLVLILALVPSKPKNAPDPAKAGDQSVAYENLPPEQKAAIKDSFNLARNLYVQGKYELCLTELAKVHESVPQFENSKELQSFCEQGRELVHRQRDLEQKEAKRKQIETQITGIVESCKASLKDTADMDETRMCLAEAIELDPEHYLITEMIHTVQMREEERKFLAQQREDVNRKAAKGEAHYQRAKAVYKKGKLAKAIVEYERFIDTDYPRIENEKAAAKRELASIRQELKSKVDQLVGTCKDLGGKQKYKEAYEACDKALEEDPSVAETKEYRDKMMAELRRDMKSIYEDSVLEESLGNVDSAKEKWKRITKEDLPFSEYAKKAKSKLQKYGMGD